MNSVESRDEATRNVRATAERSALWLALTVTLTLACTVFVFGPIQIAIGNPGAVYVPLGALAASCLAMAWPAILGIFVVTFVGARWVTPLYVIMTAAMVGCWIQGSLFVWHYGTILGNKFDFDAHVWKGVGELGFWIGLLIVLAWYRKEIARIAPALAVAIFAIQMLDIGAKLLSGEGGGPQLAKGSARAATFSTGMNVVIVILDSFQSDFLAEALRLSGYGADDLRGFTHYRNTISAYPSTLMSLPAAFSHTLHSDPQFGSEPGSSVPSDDFQVRWRKLANGTSLMSSLAKHGFDIDIVTAFPEPYLGDIPQPYGVTATELYLEDAGVTAPGDEDGLILAASVFRHVPHFLKARVFNHGRWDLGLGILGRSREGAHPRTLRDLLLLRALGKRIKVEEQPPTLRVYHLFTPHRPFDVDEKCASNSESSDYKVQIETPESSRRRAAVGAAACILGRLLDFFRAMQESGVFGRSLVVVMGDHGNTVGVRIDPSGLPAVLRATPDAPAPTWQREQACPVLLVKPVGSSGAFAVSDAPAELSDLPATISEAVGLDLGFEGRPVGALSPSEDRPRVHYDRQWIRRVLTGHSWRNDGWRRTAHAGG